MPPLESEHFRPARPLMRSDTDCLPQRRASSARRRSKEEKTVMDRESCLSLLEEAAGAAARILPTTVSPSSLPGDSVTSLLNASIRSSRLKRVKRH